VDLRRHFAIIRKWLWFFVLSVLLAAGSAFAVSSRMLPRTYEAKATLIVGQSLSAVNPDYTQLLASERLSATYAVVATKRPILDAVIKQLGLVETSDELSKQVRADAPLESTLLTISAQDVDPTRAAALANALAEQLIAASPAIQGRQAEFQESIDADLKATQDQINTTQAQIETLSGLPNRTVAQQANLQTLQVRLASLLSTYATLLSYSSGSASNLLTVIEPAIAPTDPMSPRPLLNTLLAAGLGLLLAAGVVAVIERVRDG
jgi:polysaccharide biosynthesis transport protein